MDQLAQIPPVFTPHSARCMQTKTRQGYALGALEFKGIPLPAKADSPYPLATAFTKGDLLRYLSAAGRLNTQQIFRDFAFILCL
jgi:hypothetical protein